MEQVYYVNTNEKKRTAQCLVYYGKHTTAPSFVGSICKKFQVKNERRSAINFANVVSTLSVPENSYILFDVVVKENPEVFAYYMQAGGCMGFVGNLKDEIESICYENVQVWPLSSSDNKTIELAQEHFNLSAKPKNVPQLATSPMLMAL